MKVLMLGNYPLNVNDAKIGGVTSHMISLTDTLAQLNEVDLHILTLGDANGEAVKGKKTIHVVGKRNIPLGDTFFHAGPLVKAIREIKPDIVHCQGTFTPYSTAAVKAAKTFPTVMTVHGIIKLEAKFLWPYWKLFHRFYYPRIEKRALRNLRNIITVSPYAKNEVSKITDSAIEVIPCGIDESFFSIPLNEHIANRLLSVGLITERKGLHCLMDAVNAVKRKKNDIELHLVGPIVTESYFSKIMEYMKSRELENNVTYRGVLAPDALLNEYKECSVFIFSSKEESFGLVILEAMAAGRPVVATNVGAVTWLINDNETGCIVPVGDHEALAEKVLMLIHDSGLRKSMGEKGREKAKRFTWANVAMQTFAYYQRILGKRYS